MGQVRHFSMKICVLKTRAKLITKTFHETFKKVFFKALALLHKSGPADFARETDFVHFLCVANSKTATYLYENQSPPDRISLFSRRNFER